MTMSTMAYTSNKSPSAASLVSLRPQRSREDERRDVDNGARTRLGVAIPMILPKQEQVALLSSTSMIASDGCCRCFELHNSNDTPTLPKRLALVSFGCLQNACAGGVVYGWAGIAGSMLIAPRSEGGAGLTHDETVRIFAAASSISFISPLVLGFVLDRSGPRTCSLLSNFLVAVGCTGFAVAREMSQFSWATMLIAFGGPGVGTGLVHLGNLFPEQQNLTMSLLTGIITISFSVFPIFDMIWETYGVTYQILFGAYAILILASTAASWFVWPDVPFCDTNDHKGIEAHDNTWHGQSVTGEMPYIPAQMPEAKLTMQPLESYLRENFDHHLDRSKSFMMSKKAVESGEAAALANMSLKDLPFWRQLTSGSFVRMSLFFVVTSFWANFYVASLATELGDQQDFPANQQHQLTRIFTFISASGIIGSLIIGFLLDSFGFVSTAVGTTMLGILHILLAETGKLGLMVASFVVYSLFRAFIFPYLFAMISAKMGFKYFGVLSGITFAVSGLLQLLIAPLALWAGGTCHIVESDETGVVDCYRGRWDKVHYVQVASLALLFVIPIFDVSEERSHNRVMREMFGTPRTPRTPQTLLLRKESLSSYGSTADQEDVVELLGMTV